jgi:exosortase
MVALAAWMAAAAWLYGPLMLRLAQDWTADPTYSHGFAIPPIALYLVWRQRERLRRAPIRPSLAGLAILASSLLLLAAGWLGAELFVSRLSLIGVIAGTVVYVLGWEHLRLTAFPLAFLVLMIPLPAIVLNDASFRLQLLASQAGEHLLRSFSVPVLRDGNVLTLASATLQVNDACSGIRSLVALVSLAMLGGHLLDLAWWRWLLVAAAAVPIAVGLNGVRIALTGVAVTRFGTGAAEGTLHTASGLAVFAVALGCLWALNRPWRTAVWARG